MEHPKLQPQPSAIAPGPGGEAALLERLRAGDEEAFSDLVRTHAPQMLAVAKRFMRNDDDAQDVLQDAFTSAFRALEGFAGTSRLSTWLHSITVRSALMKLRTRRRRPEQSIEELLPSFNADGHRTVPARSWTESAEELAQRKEMRELVRELIDELPESYRNVLLLRDIEELDTEETAKMLEVSQALVKTRLHRARQALRELLDQRLAGELR